MTGTFYQAAKSAYKYPLLIKQLWHTPLVQAPDQVIVYRGIKRFTYSQLRERIGQLASSLARLGVGPGDTVGVLDWDSNRFLEAYFAVPMMGAVLQTVNVRLSPEQIAHTIDHAGSSVLLVNDEFVPMLEGIRNKLPKVKQLVLMSDRAVPQAGGLTFAGEYEDLLLADSPDYSFPDFDENTVATTFYTTGTTGLPKGVYFSHRQLVLHSLAEMALFGIAAKQGRFCRDDVYMPITPMFHAHAWGFPWTATLAGVKQVYPGRYDPALLLKLIKTEGVTFTHGVPTHPANAACRGDGGKHRSCRLEDGDRRFGTAEGARQAGARAGRRRLCRLWDVGERSAALFGAGEIRGPHRRPREGGRYSNQSRHSRTAGRYPFDRHGPERSTS